MPACPGDGAGVRRVSSAGEGAGKAAGEQVNDAVKSRVAAMVRLRAHMLTHFASHKMVACTQSPYSVQNSTLTFYCSLSLFLLTTGSGHSLQAREDDRPMQLTRRFESFECDTRPVIDAFKQRGANVVKVSAGAGVSLSAVLYQQNRIV